MVILQGLYTVSFFYNKLNYIRRNPVNELIVEKEGNFLLSSAKNYAGLDSLSEIIKERHQFITC
jgi:hypothetical protein